MAHTETKSMKDAYDTMCYRSELEAVLKAERERIIAANAPEIERINAYIKSLEAAVKAEREAVAKMVEDWDSDSADPRDIADAIRARSNT
jgi:hypothetical protein